ncbi:hypothetical protein [Micromonospora sp. IBHARD004]|uniref:hypothetical protein n=1 Tax=Micromonospora sp. IBHARD004 TaxID=3457764 RepID=UPI004059739D
MTEQWAVQRGGQRHEDQGEEPEPGHRRCDGRDPASEALTNCALYLTAWQNWRGESGVGFAFYPTPPRPDTLLATAMGDMGSPVRELGDGWWWVE